MDFVNTIENPVRIANKGIKATSHVIAAQSQRDQASRQAVLNEYQKAVQTGEFSPIAGDASETAEVQLSNTTRAEVLSKINGVDLTEGDAS